MDDDGVAGLHRSLPDDVPVPEPGAVVRLQQACEVGLHLLALVIRRVDVPDLTTRVGPGLGSRAHLDQVLGNAGHAIGVAEDEPTLVLGIRFDVEDAAGEAVRNCVVQVLALPEDALAADPHQGQCFAPVRGSDRAEIHLDRGIAIRVPGNCPLESEIAESRMLHCELTRPGGVLSVGREGE